MKKNYIHFSFEYGLANFLGKRLQRAIEFTNMKSLWPTNSQPTIVVSGGVACNIRIRSVLEKVKNVEKTLIILIPKLHFFKKFNFFGLETRLKG